MADKAKETRAVIQAFDGGEKRKAQSLYNGLTDKQRADIGKERRDIALTMSELNQRPS